MALSVIWVCAEEIIVRRVLREAHLYKYFRAWERSYHAWVRSDLHAFVSECVSERVHLSTSAFLQACMYVPVCAPRTDICTSFWSPSPLSICNFLAEKRGQVLKWSCYSKIMYPNPLVFLCACVHRQIYVYSNNLDFSRQIRLTLYLYDKNKSAYLAKNRTTHHQNLRTK